MVRRLGLWSVKVALAFRHGTPLGCVKTCIVELVAVCSIFLVGCEAPLHAYVFGTRSDIRACLFMRGPPTPASFTIFSVLNR